MELLCETLAKKGVYIHLVKHWTSLKLVTCTPPSPHGGNDELSELEYQKHMGMFHGVPNSCSCTICWACMKR